MAKLPKGENTAGLNPDGTLACGTPEQMKVLQDYWKRSEAAYERGEEFTEPVPTVKPIEYETAPDEEEPQDDEADADEEADDLDKHYGGA